MRFEICPNAEYIQGTRRGRRGEVVKKHEKSILGKLEVT